MAETSEYLGEAYEALQRLSADERKRLEYEERDKALKDYQTQMNSARRQGENAGIQLTCNVLNMHAAGKSIEEIASGCGTTAEKIRTILNSMNRTILE